MIKYILGILLLVLGAGACGYHYGKSRSEIVTVEKEVHTTSKGETEIVYKDRIVIREVVHEPDGTVTERETVTDKDTTEKRETETAVAETSKEQLVRPVDSLPQYSLGLRTVVLSYSSALEVPPNTTRFLSDLEITAGRRLLGPVWLDLGVNRQSLSLGFHVEF